MDKKLYSMLCIAQKAGAVVINDYSVERSLSTGKSHLVLVPEDAGKNVKSKYEKKCFYYKKPFFIIGIKADYVQAFGKQHIGCIAISNENIAKKLEEIITLINQNDLAIDMNTMANINKEEQ